MIAPDARALRAYQIHHSHPDFPAGQYKIQFWVLDPEMQCIAMIGIHGQFSWCDLKNDLLIVGFGSYPKQDGFLMMSTLKILWQNLADTVCK
jgi:hypothetical protein